MSYLTGKVWEVLTLPEISNLPKATEIYSTGMFENVEQLQLTHLNFTGTAGRL
jgi:hypothetical protein